MPRSRTQTRSRRAKAPPSRVSPSLERREREKAETRALILAAARAMFTRDGYERTTMRGIANRIGYTATTIYHHFADKDALMLELCAMDFRALHTALTSVSQVSDPVERIRLMGLGYVRFALENTEQFRFMFLTERPLPNQDDLARLKDPGDDAFLALRNAVSEAIEGGRFRPEYRDPDLVAQMLWAAVHGIATIHVAMPPEKKTYLNLTSPEVTVAATCAAMMRGLVRDPA